jgi:DNA polymerase I-like protein with 3'-5' exonuclease and polymerase domains
MIVGVDYSSEEFLLSALASEDKTMYLSYLSGDVYLAFAKETGMVPQNATKKSHKYERDLCKSTVLGLSYSMTKIGLARKLSQDTGTSVSEEKAEELVKAFEKAYPEFTRFRRDLVNDYLIDKHLKLPCGWYMWEDNDNYRSVGNMPIQGLGASIIRKAIVLCEENNIPVLFSLHDALYIECDENDWETVDRLIQLMKDAFCFYFTGKYKDWAKDIRMEIEAWGPGLKAGETITTGNGNEVKLENIHIDERAHEEYKTFSKYFTEANLSNLL